MKINVVNMTTELLDYAKRVHYSNTIWGMFGVVAVDKPTVIKDVVKIVATNIKVDK